MRLILTILLIGLFKADAQVVINASAPYRPMVSANLLLDDYPNAAAAYSLRKLDKDYTGAAIRVRKDTTGQPEQDINFTASGELDTAALKSFLNARSGFVVTWYEQSGNGRNATQSTQSNQPRIANLGVIERQGGKPSVFFKGINDWLDFTDFQSTESYSLFYVNKRFSSTTRAPYIGSNGQGYLFAAWSDGNIYLQYSRSNNYFYRSASDNSTTLNLLQGYVTTTSQSIYKNNSLLNLSNELGFVGTTNNWSAFSYYNSNSSTNGSHGNMSECILYLSDQSSNRTGIQSNINSYYSIY